MARQSITRTLERARSAWNEKENWDQVLREAFKYAMPQRSQYEVTTPGAKKGSDTFDSTAINSASRLANRIVSVVFPAGREWCGLTAGPLVPEENKRDMNEVLEKVTKRFFAILHNVSNFQTAISEWALDLVAGTAAMVINKGDVENPFIFSAMPIINVAPEDGAHGLIGGIYRKISIKVRLIKEHWPQAELPDVLKNLKGAERDKEKELWECTYWDDGLKKWRYEVIYPTSKKTGSRLIDRMYEHPPMQVTRFMKSSNEASGRGPILNALADIKTINKLVELVLKNASLAVSGVFMGVDGDVNPDNVRIVPGGVIPVMRNPGHPSGPSLSPLVGSHDFNISQLEHERLSSSIKQMMFDNSMPPLTGPVRSATEFVERIKDLSQDVGPAFGRIISEAMVPFVQRGIDIMFELGLFNDIEDMQLLDTIRIGGVNVQLTVQSPLAMLQNLDDVEAIVRSIELVQTLIGPEAVAESFKVEEIPERLATKLGFPAELIRDKRERGVLIDKVADRLAAMSLAKQQGAPNSGAMMAA